MTSRHNDDQSQNDEPKNVKKTGRRAKAETEDKPVKRGRKSKTAANDEQNAASGGEYLGDPRFADYRDRDALSVDDDNAVDIPIEYFFGEDLLGRDMNVRVNDYEDATDFDDDFNLDFDALDDKEFDESVDQVDDDPSADNDNGGDLADDAEVTDDADDAVDEYDAEFDSMNTDENSYLSDEENDGRFE